VNWQDYHGFTEQFQPRPSRDTLEARVRRGEVERRQPGGPRGRVYYRWAAPQVDHGDVYQIDPKFLPPLETDGAATILLGECVYLLNNADCGLLKIGYSKRLLYRMGEIAEEVGCSPKALTSLATVPGDKRLERKLHHRFADSRVVGEWFKDCPEIRREFGL
jgi:hypothetical protein